VNVFLEAFILDEEKIAVLLPCYNEELTIGKVIDDFQRVLPSATIYVYDNNSKDRTVEIALEHGAIVRSEPRQGKGNVVRSMFRDIDSDYYIMADGDDTYPAEYAPQLLRPVMTGEANFVIGDRLSNGTYSEQNKRNFHDLGNQWVRNLINWVYNGHVQDIMTGYRAFDQFFVKSMPVLSPGFEIETEMTMHALEHRFLIKEIQIDYRDRPEGSESKLNTFSDGLKVLRTIFRLVKHGKPFFFFGMVALFFLLLSLVFGIPVISEYIKFHYIYRVPSAVLATGLVLMAMMFFMCGLILDTFIHKQNQSYQLDLLRLKQTLSKSKKVEKN
jgi:glycosyltransferase involved in cell wall biosynthesis